MLKTYIYTRTSVVASFAFTAPIHMQKGCIPAFSDVRKFRRNMWSSNWKYLCKVHYISWNEF